MALEQDLRVLKELNPELAVETMTFADKIRRIGNMKASSEYTTYMRANPDGPPHALETPPSSGSLGNDYVTAEDPRGAAANIGTLPQGEADVAPQSFPPTNPPSGTTLADIIARKRAKINAAKGGRVDGGRVRYDEPSWTDRNVQVPGGFDIGVSTPPLTDRNVQVPGGFDIGVSTPPLTDRNVQVPGGFDIGVSTPPLTEGNYSGVPDVPTTDTPSASTGTGFYGARDALGTGLAGALGSIVNVGGMAEQPLLDSLSAGLEFSQQGRDAALGSVARGDAAARGDLGRSHAAARQDYIDARDAGIASIDSGVSDATGRLDPYANTGRGALGMQGAMTGAYGSEAQARAYENYAETPGQKYMRERQEQSLLRNSAAIGGLGGGNVRTALQEQAFNIASTDEQRYLDNLNQLSNMGQSASTQQGQYGMSGAQNRAQLQANAGSQLGGLEQNVGSQLSALGQSSATQGAGIHSGAADRNASLTSNTGGQLSGLYQNQGTNLANVFSGYGSNLANVSYDTGLQLASAQQAMGNAIAGNYSNLGTNMGNVVNNNAGDIAAQYTNLGQGQADIRGNLASLLGNVTTGNANNLTSLALQQGNVNAANAIGQGQAWQSGLGGVANAANQYFGSQSVPTTGTVTPTISNVAGAPYQPTNIDPYGR